MWCIFFSHNCDVVVCPVHCRTHQIYRTCIHTDIFFVCMLFMDCCCNQTSVWSHHKTSKLGIDCHISHSCRNKNLFIDTANPFSDDTDIVWLLIRCIRNSDSSREIDKFNVNSRLLLKLYSLLKQYFCQHWVIIICHRITCQKCMDSKFFCSFAFEDFKRLKQLLCCHSVLGISRIVHNIIADLK